jgi:midasin
MMVYVDGIGTTSGTELVDVAKEKSFSVNFLSSLLSQDLSVEYTTPVKAVFSTSAFMLGHFEIPRGTETQHDVPFSFKAPTTAANGMKVIRAMQLRKAILLEGAPGIGKTSLITAIAAAAGHHLTRINLSDQTDLMDIFGSDVPVEGGRGGEFSWRDAPFLRAMQNGGWVLLDELNLASQSVLEGLNACLDHRGSAYIPELNRSFSRHKEFRIFAAQNPHSQGGGRKGLPKSFLNRFSVVHVESLTNEDMSAIGNQLFPEIPEETVANLISFVMTAQDEVQSSNSFGSLGRPWEFNLRDVLRWLELVRNQGGISQGRSPADYLHLVISQRLRTSQDRNYLAEIFEKKVGPLNDHPIVYSLGLETFQAGMIVTRRRTVDAALKQFEYAISVEQAQTLEVLSLCIDNAWPCVLVGPSGSGKTSMIRALASIIGAPLQEFSMSSDTDATDILGGYEQRDPYRQLNCVTVKFRNQVCKLLAMGPGPEEHALFGKLVELCSRIPTSSADASALYAAYQEVLDGLGSQSPQFLDPIEQVKRLLLEIVNDNETGKFQWYDGVLIDALTQGSWIVLDNANLCNPSVLDRLNSLLEPGGCMVLHERTDADGEPRTIVPHKNFRLFITMDPRYGELSRAMRNRAVEEPEQDDVKRYRFILEKCSS